MLMNPSSSSSSTSSPAADGRGGDVATPPSSLSSLSSRGGPPRSPTIHLPAEYAIPSTVATALLDAGHQPDKKGRGMRHDGGDVSSGSVRDVNVATSSPASTSDSSASAPGGEVVMETLVRRFLKAEGRLEAWRRADGSMRAAAATRRQRRRTATAAAAAAAATAVGADSGAASLLATRCSGLIHAVQSWWSSKTARRVIDAPAGKWGSRAHQPVQRRAVAVVPSPAFTWLGCAGRDLLGRVSRSLTLSSGRGQSTQMEVVMNAAGGGGQLLSTIGSVNKFDSSASDDESGEEEGGVRDDARRGVAARRVHSSSTVLPSLGHRVGEFAGTRSLPLSPGTSSGGSDAASSSSSGGSDDEGDVDAEPSARPAQTIAASGEDSRFTLSWIRGLRGDRSGSSAGMPATQPSRADDSFRGASRLLTKSRARFLRWLQRQRRLQCAKRAMLRERWRRFSPASRHGPSDADGDDDSAPRAPASLDAVGPPGAADAQVHSMLERVVLQRFPSSWEQTVDTTNTTATAALNTDAPATERARARAELLRVIAAVAAAREAQGHRETDERVDTAGTTASAHTVQVLQMPGQSRAERQEEEHAAALGRLRRSVGALARLRSGAPPQGEEGSLPTLAGGADVPFASSAAVFSASRSSGYVPYSQNLGSNLVDASSAVSPDVHGAPSTTATAADTSAEAFRSLLIDPAHAPHDAAVRHVYEDVMHDVCSSELRQVVGSILNVSNGATDRALSEWVARQLLLELAGMCAEKGTPGQAAREAAGRVVDFVGILRHIETRVPVSFSLLRLDDADRRALNSVQERRNSDAVAAALPTAGYTITYRQLASLSADAWLNDQVINNYLQLLCEDVERRQQRQQRQREKSDEVSAAGALHSIASMGTHFYAKVESEFSAGAGGMSSINTTSTTAAALPPLAVNSATLRWLRRRQHLLEPFRADDPQSVRAVLIPVNIEGQHWAVAVYYRDEKRWVLYDSMSRSDRARQRGLRILARLSHAWRECQRHYGLPVEGGEDHNSAVITPATVRRGGRVVVAAAYTPSVVGGKGTTAAAASPLDTLQPFGSLAELHRAAKRLRHQEAQLQEELEEKEGGCTRRRVRGGDDPVHAAAPLGATTLPSSMLTDTDVEWFTDGFARAPQQRNGNDCGVFVCQVAWCVAQGVAVSFTQADVTLLRHVIALELLTKKLLRRYPTDHTSSSADVSCEEEVHLA